MDRRDITVRILCALLQSNLIGQTQMTDADVDYLADRAKALARAID